MPLPRPWDPQRQVCGIVSLPIPNSASETLNIVATHALGPPRAHLPTPLFSPPQLQIQRMNPQSAAMPSALTICIAAELPSPTRMQSHAAISRCLDANTASKIQQCCCNQYLRMCYTSHHRVQYLSQWQAERNKSMESNFDEDSDSPMLQAHWHWAWRARKWGPHNWYKANHMQLIETVSKILGNGRKTGILHALLFHSIMGAEMSGTRMKGNRGELPHMN